jgi:plasmid stabilization system protein ParE
MMKIIWTGAALREIEAIGEYIARKNQEAAERIVHDEGHRAVGAVALSSEPKP